MMRLARWLLAGALLALVLAFVVGAALPMLLAEAAREGLHITINGQPWAALELNDENALPGVLAAGLSVLSVGLAALVLSYAGTLSLALAPWSAIALPAGLALAAQWRWRQASGPSVPASSHCPCPRSACCTASGRRRRSGTVGLSRPRTRFARGLPHCFYCGRPTGQVRSGQLFGWAVG